MRALKKLSLLLVVCLLVLAISVQAEITPLITYQSQLTDDTGTPIDGAQLIKFIIYDAPTAGVDLWNSNYQTVAVSNGIFSVELGAAPMPALPDNLFENTTSVYLGVTVGVDPEISPRTKLTSAPSAYHALRADSAGIATTVPDYAITRQKLADNAVGSQQIGNGAVTLDDMAIGSVGSAEVINESLMDDDIGDEPGIGSSYSAARFYWPSDTSGTGTLLSVEINCPTSGYVVVMASCTWRPTHVNGQRDLARFFVTTAANASDFNRAQMVTLGANIETSSDYPIPVAHHTVYEVAAGTHSFYYTMNRYSGGDFAIDDPRITAQFFPTSYGSVTTKSSGEPVDPNVSRSGSDLPESEVHR